MIVSDPSLFNHRRLLPTGSMTQGPGLIAGLSATGATISLLLAVFVVALLVGVVASSAPRIVSSAELVAIRKALGEATPNQLQAHEDETGVPAPSQISGLGTVPLLLHGDYVGPGWLIALSKSPLGLTQTATAIPRLALIFALLLLLHHFLELVALSRSEKVGAASARRLRSAIHRQALRLNLGDLDGKGRRQAQALFTSQSDAVTGSLTHLVFHVVRDPLRIGLCFLAMLAIDWRLTLLCLLPASAAWAYIESERRRGVAQQKLADSRATRSLRLLSEGLGKSRLIRGYGMESSELEKFDSQLERYVNERDSGSSSWRKHQRLSWAAAIVVIGVVLYLVGMKVAFDATVTAADAIAFLLLLSIVIATLFRGRDVPGSWLRAKVASEQVNRYLERIPEVSQAVGAKFLEPVSKGIAFEGVTLHRGGRTLFENLELRLEAGSRTALVSLDPTEARAAAFLLPRFLEPDSGRILFDGEDIAWGTLESLRAECCYVGGREPFFTGTIAENIAAADDFSDTQILEAAKKAHVHKFIAELPDGYETVVGEHGQSLPSGYAFLLGLARAIIRNPAVIIVEEPDGILDDDLKALMEDAYNRCLAERTVLFLPRRLSTVRRANKVVLLSEGKVAAMGPQEELVKKNALYRHWEYTTFSPFGRSQRKLSNIEQALAQFDPESYGVE